MDLMKGDGNCIDGTVVVDLQAVDGISHFHLYFIVPKKEKQIQNLIVWCE